MHRSNDSGSNVHYCNYLRSTFCTNQTAYNLCIEREQGGSDNLFQQYHLKRFLRKIGNTNNIIENMNIKIGSLTLSLYSLWLWWKQPSSSCLTRLGSSKQFSSRIFGNLTRAQKSRLLVHTWHLRPSPDIEQKTKILLNILQWNRILLDCLIWRLEALRKDE